MFLQFYGKSDIFFIPNTLIDEKCSTNVNTYKFGNFIITCTIEADLLKRFSIFVKKITS